MYFVLFVAYFNDTVSTLDYVASHCRMMSG